MVLYEMLTGAKSFPGDTITDVLGAIVHKEPDWTALPTDVPARVRALMEHCLQKDPRARLRDIGDARREFDAGDAVAGWSKPPVRSRARTAVVLTIAAAIVAALSFPVGRSQTAPTPPENTPRLSETRFAIVPPKVDVDTILACPYIWVRHP